MLESNYLFHILQRWSFRWSCHSKLDYQRIFSNFILLFVRQLDGVIRADIINLLLLLLER